MKLGPAAQTYAIVIGIENYGSPEWVLNGPAMDALRMADWLYTRGVPAGNIQLYINEATQISDELAVTRANLKASLVNAGVVLHTEPTRSVLEQALDPGKLPALPGASERTLIIYACGHGIWNGGTSPRRYLITADASLESGDAINLTYVANQLCHHRGTNHFTRQWLIQDTCAQVPKDFSVKALNSTNEPEGVASHRQYLLCASRPGKLTINDRSLQTGEFAVALFKALEPYKTTHELDIDEVCKSIDATPWGKLNPTTLYRRDAEMQSWDYVPSAPNTDVDALNALQQIFDGTEKLTTSLLQTVVRACAGGTEPISPNVMTMLKKLDLVVGGSADGSLTTVEQFVIRLYSLLLRIRTSTGDSSWDEDIHSLKAWIRNWPRARANPAVNQEFQRLKIEDDAIARSGLIIIDLSGSSDPSETRVWDYRDEAPEVGQIFTTPQLTLSERLRSALEQVCSGFNLCGDTVLEVVLPAANVFEPYSGIEFCMDDGASHYLGRPPALLALRISERWHDRGWNRAWQHRWNNQTVGAELVATMVWLEPQDVAVDSGWSWHGITNLPPHRVAIQRALKAGVAFAAWCEPDQIEKVTAVVQGQPFIDLPKTRVNLTALNKSLPHCVTYVIDHPGQIPPGAGGYSSTLKQPAPRT